MLRPSPLACTECRKHHIKCDSKKPSCSRCLDHRLECNYIPSRRGGRRKPRVVHPPELSPGASSASTHPPESVSPPLPGQPEIPDSVSGNDVYAASFGDSSTQHNNNHHNTQPEQGPSMPSPVVPDVRLVRLYYENFHAAHPILVPAYMYDDRKYPGFLQQVVRCIGMQFAGRRGPGNNPLQESTALQLRSTVERSPCLVQALLLYSIFLCALDEGTDAQATFSRAIALALELGMYQRSFATTFSNGGEIEAESLRRTWWELFIFEISLASLHQGFSLRCGDVPSDALLPCEETVYASRATIPPSSSLSQFKMRVFTDEDDDGDIINNNDQLSRFSSFSYRIDAVCILARVLVLNRLPDAHEDHLQAVANALVSWTNHLPRNKVDIVDMYGNVDEMLFQAHTTIHYAAMLLHLPRSNIRPDMPDIGFTICPTTQYRPSPSLTRHVHDIKATEGSKKLSNLLSVRPTAQGNCPLLVFGMTLCGLVQLATSKIHSVDCLDHHCNRVVLVLGCLKSLKRHWPVAQKAYYHLRRVAGETFATWVESQYPHASPSLARIEKSNGSANGNAGGHLTFDDSSVGGRSANNELSNAEIQRLFSPRILSSYVDPTCSDPFLLNHMGDFDVL